MNQQPEENEENYYYKDLTVNFTLFLRHIVADNPTNLLLQKLCDEILAITKENVDLDTRYQKDKSQVLIDENIKLLKRLFVLVDELYGISCAFYNTYKNAKIRIIFTMLHNISSQHASLQF